MKKILVLCVIALFNAMLIGCQPETIEVKNIDCLRQVKKVAILPFSDGPGLNGRNSGSAVSGFIIGKLSACNRYKLVERSQLQSVIGEKDLSMSTFTDASEAAKAGKLLGVDAIIIGSVSEYEHHRGIVPIPYLSVPTSEYTISATLRMVNVANAEAIYAISESGKSGQSFAGAGKELADKMIQPILNIPVQ